MQWFALAKLVVEIIGLFKGKKSLQEDLKNAKTSEARLAVALRASAAE